MGRRGTVPRWYSNMVYVNLSDFDAGHAVLAVEQGSLGLETISTRRGCKEYGEPTDPNDA